MNKQELKQLISATDYAGTTVSKEFKKGFREGMKISADMLEQLDEPQKHVMPKFVAEWFEDNKHALDLAIFTKIRELDGKRYPHETDFENWLDNAENNPIETLIRMKDGYEVEKKPKYIVKIGKLYLKEPLGDTSNFTILTTWDKKCAYPFSSFHMADIHAAKFEGTVEEVTEE
ncbi:DUF1642 domain-containing protein [Enterococcus faecium]|uniref:DUF1642 domain-containing protein n=1 Tax=Enterococcus faecium TaxID=1352 RepID=UPI00241443F6|nr:DUF1642 domain-containing protein [Enterococcus faecium]MDG4589884.1 DUF1642 domain-containing protein [Enterococcus faecium]